MRPFSYKDSEWLTRKQLIDPKLKAAGWRVVAFDPNKPLSAFDRCAIEEFPTENGPADYALCVNGKILGIVEAKKLPLGPQNVLTQAERYSKGATSSPLPSVVNRLPSNRPTTRREKCASNENCDWLHSVIENAASPRTFTTSRQRSYARKSRPFLLQTMSFLRSW